MNKVVLWSVQRQQRQYTRLCTTSSRRPTISLGDLCFDNFLHQYFSWRRKKKNNNDERRRRNRSSSVKQEPPPNAANETVTLIWRRFVTI
mmetsp:Transcript_32345/g.67472  ORF Transcript_32345/g.67472 Transcript_32345/m.67472 type:complete len:90 (+) Transcript_32345:659-928(+)